MLQMMPGGMPGAMPQQAGNGMSLQQLLAMLQQSQGGGGGGGGMQLPSPGTATPMSNYIGAPGGGAGMVRPAMAPVGNPQPQPMGGGTAPGGGMAQGNPLMALLAQLKAGQTGIPPGGGPGTTGAQMTANPFNGMTPVPAQPGMPPPNGNTGAGMMANPFSGMTPPPPGGMPPGGLPGAVPGGAGQMNPALLQWLHGMFNGGAGGGGGGGGMGAGGGG